MSVCNRIRFVNKAFTNKVLIRLAGKANSPFALLRHVGRKSGRVYKIPVLPARTEKGFIFALTYGPQVDWFRNIQAKNGAELKWHEQDFILQNPVLIDGNAGRGAFGKVPSSLLRIFAVRNYISMEATPK